MKRRAECRVSGIALCLCTALAGCSREAQPQIRHYREIAVLPEATAPRSAPMPQQPMAAPAAGSVKVAWTCPQGWIEQPGAEMRLATFLVGPDKAECTIVSFPGEAGGLKPNIKRWVGQLKLNTDDQQLDTFMLKQPSITTDGGFPCTLFDFSGLLPEGESGGTSMLAAIAAAGGNSIFVKLTGSAALLSAEKERFNALCKSLKSRDD